MAVEETVAHDHLVVLRADDLAVLLIPFAPLSDPFRGACCPRSIIFWPFHKNASLPPLLVADVPATHPDALIAFPC